jgi:type II secretory pathway component PulM
MDTKKILIGVGIIAGGVVLYNLLKKDKKNKAETQQIMQNQIQALQGQLTNQQQDIKNAGQLLMRTNPQLQKDLQTTQQNLSRIFQ